MDLVVIRLPEITLCGEVDNTVDRAIFNETGLIFYNALSVNIDSISKDICVRKTHCLSIGDIYFHCYEIAEAHNIFEHKSIVEYFRRHGWSINVRDRTLFGALE